MKNIPAILHVFVSIGIIYVSLHRGYGRVLLRTREHPRQHLKVGTGGKLGFTKSADEASVFLLEEPGLAGGEGTVSIRSEENGQYITFSNNQFELRSASGDRNSARDATFVKEKHTFLQHTYTFLYERRARYLSNQNGILGWVYKWEASDRKQSLSFHLVKAKDIPTTEWPTPIPGTDPFLPPPIPLPRAGDDLWTSCSRTCGSGRQMKIKWCPVDGCNVESRICNEGTCKRSIPGCSRTCGGGFVRVLIPGCRGRRCPKQRLPCNTHPCVSVQTIGMCDHNMCKNSGKCYEVVGGFGCACQAFYSGNFCEIGATSDHCDKNACENGDCVSTLKSYKCKCYPGYKGRKCIHDVCAMDSPCVNGVCVKTDGRRRYTCECPPTHKGKHCEKATNQCRPNPCKNSGRCETLGGGRFRCECTFGYTGPSCDVAIDQCQPNPCNNGGRCEKLGGGRLRCECSSGYTGAYCDDVADACQALQPCENGGDCLPSSPDADGYICFCPPTHTGDNCEEAVDACLFDPCGINGLCRMDGLAIKCECLPGFGGDFCDETINPCEPSPCGPGNCLSIPDGSFLCVCPPSVTGLTCSEAINPCEPSPCGPGRCLSTPNGGFLCLCPPTHSGTTCSEVVNACHPNPCKHGTCARKPVGFICICENDYTGLLCDEKINNCRNTPCVNGECSLSNDGFSCICYAGFMGDRCDEERDYCNPSPCQHGTCTSSTKGASCTCDEDYTGAVCDTMINHCDPNPCKDGTCIQLQGGFTCECGVGKSGVLCEEVNFCIPNPCIHGTCSQKKGGYECACDQGYIGRNCDKESKDPCDSAPCRNGGSCVSYDDMYWCHCALGNHGKNCEKTDVFDVTSKCTKTCGGGSRYKVPKCAENDITKCRRVYEACNLHSCPANPACALVPGLSSRYKVRSKCCNATATSQTCGKPYGTISKRIIGGYLAKQGMWPWAVLLHVRTRIFTNSTCGGTLIHKDWVLTAGHCAEDVEKERITAIFGTTNPLLHHKDMQSRKIEKIIMHEEFAYPVNDLALLKLEKSVDTSEFVRPICLPNGEQVAVDTLCFAAGWGVAKVENIIKGIPSDDLMEIGFNHLDFRVCKSGYTGTTAHKFMNPKMMCAGSISGGVDTCVGDSGGPLMCQRCDSCSWYIAGVVSFGSSNCGIPGRPGVYSNVLLYEDWIRKHADIPKSEKFKCTK